MNKNTAATNLSTAQNNRRRLQAEGADQATIAAAISVERLAREDFAKFERATMAEGFRWNR